MQCLWTWNLVDSPANLIRAVHVGGGLLIACHTLFCLYNCTGNLIQLFSVMDEAVNPFEFWKERDIEASTHGAPIQSQANGSSKTTPRRALISELTGELLSTGKNKESRDGSCSQQNGSKRRPPPRPPNTPTRSPSHGAKPKSLDARLTEMDRSDLHHGNESDANSYIPKSKKSPGLNRHKVVTKTVSNPVESKSFSKSCSASPPKINFGSFERRLPKFVPSITTIRCSTGSQLSVDDLELYRPQRYPEQKGRGRVLDIAKQLDASLLSPPLPMPTAGRRGSSNDIVNKPQDKVWWCSVLVR